MGFREISYSMRGIIWITAIGCFLAALFFSSIDHSWYNTVLWIVSLLSLIWAFWASFSAHEPLKK